MRIDEFFKATDNSDIRYARTHPSTLFLIGMTEVSDKENTNNYKIFGQARKFAFKLLQTASADLTEQLCNKNEDLFPKRCFISHVQPLTWELLWTVVKLF